MLFTHAVYSGRFDAEAAVRVGDVYALLVYYHAAKAEWPAARALVADMLRRGLQLEPFIESDVLRAIEEGGAAGE